MDLEQLSKTQIILLTLFVSFVTSIATGIVTVSLMEQAPPAFAQTVNRVIERTVEKVVPTSQGAATVITQEKTVVVKEADLLASAVQKVAPSVVRLYKSGTEETVFLGLGLVLNKDGTIVTDSAALGDLADASVVLADGTTIRAFVNSRDAKNSFAFLQAATTTKSGEGTKAVVFAPVVIASEAPILGSSVLVLAGRGAMRIADGIVTAVTDVTDTSISGDSILRGSPFINADGNVVGVSTSAARASSPSAFVPATTLLPRPNTE